MGNNWFYSLTRIRARVEGRRERGAMTCPERDSSELLKIVDQLQNEIAAWEHAFAEENVSSCDICGDPCGNPQGRHYECACAVHMRGVPGYDMDRP